MRWVASEEDQTKEIIGQGLQEAFPAAQDREGWRLRSEKLRHDVTIKSKRTRDGGHTLGEQTVKSRVSLEQYQVVSLNFCNLHHVCKIYQIMKYF